MKNIKQLLAVLHKALLNQSTPWCWWALIGWSAAGYAVTVFKIDAGFIHSMHLPQRVDEFVSACLPWGDFIFLFLAALNVFHFAIDHLGWKTAGKSFVVIALGSAAIETLGTLSGFPFGYYLYTSNLGPRIFGILPLAIPLAWWAVIGGFYFVIRSRFPRWNQRWVALGSAACATAFDRIMEPFAWLVKQYWIWVPGYIPWQNYVAWFALSFLLARLAPLHGQQAPANTVKPALILALMAGLFILGRWVG